MIALKEAHKSGLLTRSHWATNIGSGVVVGVVAIPLAMAFAIASGAQPEQGLYTAFISGIVVSIFGGSRVQIAGPTGAFIVILASITAKYGMEGLMLSTMMAGVILFLMGLTRMGALIKFIPIPVILGFTAGIGVVIWVGQWKEFFGLPSVEREHFHEKLAALIRELPNFHPPTTALGLLSLLILLAFVRFSFLKKIPGPLPEFDTRRHGKGR